MKEINEKIWRDYKEFSTEYHKFLNMPVKKKRFYPEEISNAKWSSMASTYDNYRKRHEQEMMLEILKGC